MSESTRYLVGLGLALAPVVLILLGIGIVTGYTSGSWEALLGVLAGLVTCALLAGWAFLVASWVMR